MVRRERARGDVGVREDRGEDVVEVVCDAPRERAEALDPLRPMELRLERLPLRDVGLDHEDDEGRSDRVADQRRTALDDAPRTRPRATTDLGGGLSVAPQRLSVHVAELALGIDELSEPAADGLRAREPEESERARVPVPHGVVEAE